MVWLGPAASRICPLLSLVTAFSTRSADDDDKDVRRLVTPTTMITDTLCEIETKDAAGITKQRCFLFLFYFLVAYAVALIGDILIKRKISLILFYSCSNSRALWGDNSQLLWIYALFWLCVFIMVPLMTNST